MWRTWGIQCGVVSALARRLHGHTILKFMRLARLKKNGVEPGTIELDPTAITLFLVWGVFSFLPMVQCTCSILVFPLRNGPSFHLPQLVVSKWRNWVPASGWHGLSHSLLDPTDHSLTSSKYGQKSLKRTYTKPARLTWLAKSSICPLVVLWL